MNEKELIEKITDFMEENKIISYVIRINPKFGDSGPYRVDIEKEYHFI